VNAGRLTLTEAVEKLAALGSPQQIADFFQAEGIHGLVGHAHSCPVARYVQQVTGAGRVWVSPSREHNGGVGGVGNRYSCYLPRAVNDFALAFDNEEYRGLIQ
jgi:hypothetical protein